MAGAWVCVVAGDSGCDRAVKQEPSRQVSRRRRGGSSDSTASTASAPVPAASVGAIVTDSISTPAGSPDDRGGATDAANDGDVCTDGAIGCDNRKEAGPFLALPPLVALDEGVPQPSPSRVDAVAVLDSDSDSASACSAPVEVPPAALGYLLSPQHANGASGAADSGAVPRPASSPWAREPLAAASSRLELSEGPVTRHESRVGEGASAFGGLFHAGARLVFFSSSQSCGRFE